jgi:hypothetical protein
MNNLYFFDLPVYRLSCDEYNTHQAHDIENQISYIMKENPYYDLPEKNRVRIQQHQYEKYGPWQFNEIIGHIRLYFRGRQILGEYFSAEKKRNVRSRNKVFVRRTHKLAAEVSIAPNKNVTDEEIFVSVKTYIADCKRELAKGRVIYDHIFMTIGPHINWRELLSWE